ncbi:MAG: ABC transporter permease [Cytophagales bacterium]|nr:ABC transporter permease [Cytophagales bacterium]
MNSPFAHIAIRFLRWFCDPEILESLEGDLVERFERKYKVRKYASWYLVRDVIRLFRPGIIRSFSSTQKNNYTMLLKHNLLITLRGFKRYKTTFAINLLGLTISLTSVLFIGLWVSDELGKDRFHADSDRLFQVYTRQVENNSIDVWHGVSGMLADEIEAQIPQVNHTLATTDVHEYTLSTDKKGIRANGMFADRDFLNVFSFELIEGNRHALEDPSSIFITRALAKRLFDKEDVMGEVLTWHQWGQTKQVQVAGILEDLSNDTSEPFEFVMSWKFYHDEFITFKGWGNFYGRIIVKLDDPSQLAQIEEKLNAIIQENLPGTRTELFLTSYADRYLYGRYENGVQAGGRIDYVYVLSVIGLFILLIAAINFINLTTANAALKSKEIGLKKSFGASRSVLAFQFFMESLLLCAMAATLAYGIIYLLLTPFNQLAQKELTLSMDWPLIVSMVAFLLITGILAGVYPAIYLSGVKAINALKQQFGSSGEPMQGRKILVVIQFTISIVMIVGTLIVGEQMNYVLNKQLGYDRHNVIYFERDGTLLQNYDAFLGELNNTLGIEMAALTGFSLDYQNRTAGIGWEGKEEDQVVSFWENSGDENSLTVLDLQLNEGRLFDASFNDENSIIFNETAIRIMGLEDPIGQTVQHYSGEKKIIGVIKDFTTESLHKSEEPAMFFYRPDYAPFIMARIDGKSTVETLHRVEELYHQYNPSHPFDPTFLDQDYQAKYDSETRLSKLSALFTGLAILISCLGLFGLAVFSVARKTKEIGIRKVLGCSVRQLTFSMTYGFTRPVLWSMFIAVPTSYFIGAQWLDSFAARIEISWWFFALATITAILIAWLTVGIHTLRAASANPLNALRDE